MGIFTSRAAVATSLALPIATALLTVAPGVASAATVMRASANYPLVASATPSRGVDVPGLAVDPANPNHIVEANIDALNGECDFHVSTDGGHTWTGGQLTLPTADPSLAFPTPACAQNFDSGGYAHFNTGIVFGSAQNVYITFSIHRGPFNRPESGPGSDGGFGDDAVVARSTDGGHTFAPAVIAVPGGGATSANPGLAGYGMRPQIAVQPGAGTGGQDRLYVDSWNCFIRIQASQTSRGGCSGGGGDRRIFVTRSDDGGTTWTTPVLASAANVRSGTVTPPTGPAGEAGSSDEQAVEPSQPVIGPNGTVYVAYKSRDLTDGTTCPTNPSRPPLQPATTGFSSQKAWCVVVSRSTDGGKTWTQTSTGVPIPSGRLTNPRLAIDPSGSANGKPYPIDPSVGKLYVVYQSQSLPATASACTPPACDPSDIIEQSSSDGGVTWSAPVKVNDDPPGAVQTNPFAAVGPGGVLDVIWNDQRLNYPGSSTVMGNIYFAQSTDGGQTFSANRRVTDRSINVSVGLYSYLAEDFSTGFDWYGPTILPLPDGSVLASWADSRGGSYDSGFQDIYLSRLTPNAPIAQSTIATATPDGLSVDLSSLAYPGGNEQVGANPVSKLVVVNDSDVASALAGAVLARKNFAPMYLSPSAGLTPVEQADAARILPEGAYVIGSTTALTPAVSAQLTAATRNHENVDRIAPANSVAVADRPADIARQIALLLAPLPGSTPTAVIVNPSTPEAAAGSALAASLDYPILFVDSRTATPPASPIPSPTLAAISSLGIKKLLIIGGTGAVNAADETALDNLLGAANVTRIGGTDQYATSQAVVTASIARGLPGNIVYAADGGRPIDGALLGSAVARLGGLMLLTPGASTATAASTLATMGIDAGTDRIVGAIGTGGTDPTVPPALMHTLTVSFSGTGAGTITGSVACTSPKPCSQSFAPGTSVTLTATAAPGSTFAGWSGACGHTGACTLTMSSDLSVTATFFRNPPKQPHAKCKLKLKNGRHGRLRVRVLCNQAAIAALRGVLTETIHKRHGKVRRFHLGPIAKRVKANVAATVEFKLPSRARSGLSNGAHEKVTVKLFATNPNGASKASAKLTLRP